MQVIIKLGQFFAGTVFASLLPFCSVPVFAGQTNPLPPAASHTNPTLEYSAGLYKPVKASVGTFDQIYMNNKSRWAFNKFENDDNVVLIDYDASEKNKNSNISNTSPYIDKDSNVESVYIRTNINKSIHILDNN